LARAVSNNEGESENGNGGETGAGSSISVQGSSVQAVEPGLCAGNENENGSGDGAAQDMPAGPCAGQSTSQEGQNVFNQAL